MSSSLVLKAGRNYSGKGKIGPQLITFFANALTGCCVVNARGMHMLRTVRITGLSFEVLPEEQKPPPPPPRIHALNLMPDAIHVTDNGHDGPGEQLDGSTTERPG